LSGEGRQASLERLARTLAVGVVGGGAFALAGLPAPWLSGPATAVALAGLAGRDLAIPVPVRWVTLAVLGATMGSAVTPETFATLARWPASILGLAVAVFAVMMSVSLYLERIHGYDRITARLCAIPGAFPFVLALAAESDADQRRVAIVQMVRLVALVALIPGLLALSGAEPRAPSTTRGSGVHLGEIAILIAGGFVGAFLAERLRAPAAALFGGLIGGALLYGSGAISSALPAWLLIPAFVIIGSLVGTNFSGLDRLLFVATLRASLGGVAVAALASFAIAAPAAMLLGLPTVQVWIAYAPGGVDVMAVMAMALGLDPAYVGGHHVIRFLGLGVFVPWWLSGYLKRSR
jgi:hypothetical protein